MSSSSSRRDLSLSVTDPEGQVGDDARAGEPIRPPEQLGGLRLARVTGVDASGRQVLVEVDGASEAMTATLAVGLEARQLAAATAGDVLAVLALGQGDAGSLVIGFVPAPGAAPRALASPPAKVVEADVDGRRVQITAADEVVFKCGKASITLRRNGRVIIRGTHVESHSEGTNRIKGGQVRIN